MSKYLVIDYVLNFNGYFCEKMEEFEFIES
jgi:hypothetical protein